MLDTVYQYSKRPEPFADGTGNIWTEPYIAAQMLKAHLNREQDGASRKETTIDQSVAYLHTLLAPGSTVLDLGCGPGLYAERLARLGYRVTGVDFSENSIRYATEHAKKQGLEITYRNADFFSLEDREAFDAVIQVYGELNTFADAARDRLLALILRALRPGGLFVFDVTTPNVHSGEREQTSWYAADGGFYRPGKHLVLESTIPYENDVCLEQYTVIDETGATVYRTWFRDYTPDTIRQQLLRAGFTGVQVSDRLYGQAQQTPDWLTVLAKK